VSPLEAKTWVDSEVKADIKWTSKLKMKLIHLLSTFTFIFSVLGGILNCVVEGSESGPRCTLLKSRSPGVLYVLVFKDFSDNAKRL